MYAIIQTGGKQYRVAPGDVLRVERLPGERGDAVQLDQVLLVTDDNGSVQVGSPLVAGATVKGEILRQGKAKKVLVFKKKRRKGFKKIQGHRQMFTAVQIQEIIV